RQLVADGVFPTTAIGPAAAQDLGILRRGEQLPLAALRALAFLQPVAARLAKTEPLLEALEDVLLEVHQELASGVSKGQSGNLQGVSRQWPQREHLPWTGAARWMSGHSTRTGGTATGLTPSISASVRWSR